MLSRSIPNGTDHCRLRNSPENISLHFPGHPGLNRRPLNLQWNNLPLNYKIATANLCFASRRNGYENAFSRNIQNRTDHCRLRNSKETFIFTSLKKGTPGLEPRTSRTAVKCSTTELYPLGS
ncbi:hypothetical protein TNCV_4306341 [Trichonephila clavipes]|nr:hypothetical protein TNCV_4306341 [Trichonephila clavipes]